MSEKDSVLQVGRLVCSHTMSFGRIIAKNWNSITVKFSYGAQSTVSYTFEDALYYLDVYSEDEKSYAHKKEAQFYP